MTVDLGDHDLIALDLAVIRGLFTPAMPTLLHLIHHELGHVHDHVLRRRLGWSWKLRSERFSPLRRRLYPLAEQLYCEYQAERISAGTIPGESIHVPILVDLLPCMEAEIPSLVAPAKGESFAQLDLAMARICSLLQIAGYILGDQAGTGADPGQVHPELPALLARPPLSEVWDSLREDLDRLYQTQAQWGSPVVFRPLEVGIVRLIRLLGVDISPQDRPAI
jgi:hypothetical protein